MLDRPQLVEVRDRYEHHPYYVVVTSDTSEIGRLKQLAQQKGLEVKVRRSDTFDAAMTFLRQL